MWFGGGGWFGRLSGSGSGRTFWRVVYVCRQLLVVLDVWGVHYAENKRIRWRVKLCLRPRVWMAGGHMRE